jgi:hypothetical protein
MNDKFLPLPQGINFIPNINLRDYFAGMALSGLLQESNVSYEDDALAELAYSLADAMMEARK